jgi:hypothetical protein
LFPIADFIECSSYIRVSITIKFPSGNVTDCNLFYLTEGNFLDAIIKLQHSKALPFPVALKPSGKSGHVPVTTNCRKNEELG